MTKSSTISKRGKKASQTELRTDMELFFEASNDIWSPKNKKGKFPLNMAENNLNWDLMSNKIHQILKKKPLPKWVSNYTGIAGEEGYLKSIAQFMSKHVSHCEISPEHIATSAGATAVIELASWVTCDADDVAVIPAPSYPVYTQDIGNKSRVKRYDLITHHEISEIRNRSNVTISKLNSTHNKLKKKGKNFRLLILTSPDNPTGNIYSYKVLSKVADWCNRNQIHLIVNELYALSIIKPAKNKNAFTSFAKIMSEQKSDYLHMIYGLSKDFGMSGFRVGVFYSQNEDILAAYRNLNAPHMVSNVTQYIVKKMLSDDEFIKNYIKTNQKSITTTFKIVAETLEHLNIDFVKSKGSLFVWLDLSKYLKKQSKKAEHTLWLQLYEETGILLTPATGFGHSKRGQFRLVHTFLKPMALRQAMKKFGAFIKKQ